MRLSKHLATVQQAAAFKAIAEADTQRITELRQDLQAARKENARLVTAILQLKQQGHALMPWDTDEQWGRYVMSDAAEDARPKPEPRSAPAENPGVIDADADAEIRAELERELGL